METKPKPPRDILDTVFMETPVHEVECWKCPIKKCKHVPVNCPLLKAFEYFDSIGGN